MGYAVEGKVERLFARFQERYALPFAAEGDGRYWVMTCGESGAWPVCCRLEGSRIFFSSELPLQLWPEQAGEVMAYVGRVNRGNSVGSFEVDMEAGRIRYKCGVELDGLAEKEMASAPRLLANLFYGSLAMVVEHIEPLRRMTLGEGRMALAWPELLPAKLDWFLN